MIPGGQCHCKRQLLVIGKNLHKLKYYSTKLKQSEKKVSVSGVAENVSRENGNQSPKL